MQTTLSTSNPRNADPSNVPQNTQATRPNQGQYASGNRPICQICGKTGHTALDCYHRFDYSYQDRHPPAELAAMVAESNAAYEHQVWYADSGTNAHMTSEAENLTHQQPFTRQDTVTVGQTLLHGQVENGLYPIAGNKSLQNKLQCLTTTIDVTTSMNHWHSRLGHL
ncbi:hypothetical protein CK203_007505 [Vitis vinifera]|uniref:CCHC-type domain-containing protein n=1 Tax=Vitis vinifera TaxID=29760 RepID=A0A438G1T7_VITVI|nr:hypothetical protein CK203_007505 [Vitis vinifera]